MEFSIFGPYNLISIIRLKMKKSILLLIALLTFFPMRAQKGDFTYKFYGFVRGDLFYNSRANMAPIDGNFYLYPLGKSPDANGKDLNATPNGSFYTFTSRLGLDVTGPNVGKARTAAKIETDFGGFSGSHTMLRLRQAYVSLDWGRSDLLVGVTWHPLFGAVVPDVLNLSTGAPYQPFNRSPQLRFRQKFGKAQLSAALVWQLQYLSNGPMGMSEDYIKNSCVPEGFLGVDVVPSGPWLWGAGVHVISLKPRTSSTLEGETYRVNERMTTFSCEAHLKYQGKNFTFAAKSFWASALDQVAMLGGYGVSSIDPATGEQEYTPFRHSTSWVNLTYGSKWKAAFFLGYTKNLGTDSPLVSADKVYGMGLDIDQLVTVNVNLSYNLPHWQFGFEYCPATALYGTNDLATGRVGQTYAVTNHRILGLMMYYF